MISFLMCLSHAFASFQAMIGSLTIANEAMMGDDKFPTRLLEIFS